MFVRVCVSCPSVRLTCSTIVEKLLEQTAVVGHNIAVTASTTLLQINNSEQLPLLSSFFVDVVCALDGVWMSHTQTLVHKVNVHAANAGVCVCVCLCVECQCD